MVVTRAKIMVGFQQCYFDFGFSLQSNWRSGSAFLYLTSDYGGTMCVQWVRLLG